MSDARFHLAFLVTDLEATRAFYCNVLGCGQGRKTDRWIDFDLHGHQISAHLIDGQLNEARRSAVDGDGVPVPHFGLILTHEAWCGLRDRLIAHGTVFELPPRVRFEGMPGEQWTMFVSDPSGNFLEFKSFASSEAVFASC